MHLSKLAAIHGGLRDNKNQTALVGVGEHWMFGEVLSIMFQELAQLPTDLCRITSFPAALSLLRTFSKVPVTFLTGSAATAPQEGVLVPVKRLSWLHLGHVSPVPSSQRGTHGCRSSSSLPQQDQFSAHTPAQHTQAWAPGHVRTLNHDLHSQLQLPTPNPSLNYSHTWPH